MRIGIMTGGSVEPTFVKTYCEEKPVDLWIGVDRGMEALYALQIIPACIVGDFDSVDPAVLSFYQKQNGIDWHVFRPEKDDTDTELAIRQALEREPQEMVIFGGTGTRFDHMLGTLHVTKLALDADVYCEIVDSHNRIYLLKKDTRFQKEEVFGKYISFLPFGAAVKGFTLKGFKYPLEDHVLEPGSSLTVSNELAASEAFVSLKEGIVIVVEARD